MNLLHNTLLWLSQTKITIEWQKGSYIEYIGLDLNITCLLKHKIFHTTKSMNKNTRIYPKSMLKIYEQFERHCF